MKCHWPGVCLSDGIGTRCGGRGTVPARAGVWYQQSNARHSSRPWHCGEPSCEATAPHTQKFGQFPIRGERAYETSVRFAAGGCFFVASLLAMTWKAALTRNKASPSPNPSHSPSPNPSHSPSPNPSHKGRGILTAARSFIPSRGGPGGRWHFAMTWEAGVAITGRRAVSSTRGAAARPAVNS